MLFFKRREPESGSGPGKQMSVDSPVKPESGKGMSRKPALMGILLIVILLSALCIVITKDKTQKVAQDEKDAPTGRNLTQSLGTGVLLPPQNFDLPVTPQPPAPPPSKIERAKKEEPEDEIKKRKELLYMNALTSELIKKNNNGDAGGNPPPQGTQVNIPASGGDKLASANYDPAAAKDREQFFERADTTGEGWLSRYTREEGRKLEIKTGTVVPAVMISGINSDLPGVISAQVSQNVYNTSNGKYLLIPQGTRLYGTYDSRVAYGQERVLIAWNRIIYPDGSSLSLGAMPGADESGYAGFADQVNNHYWRIFGSAFLMSAIIAGTTYTVDSMDENDNYYNSDKPDLKKEMVTQLAQQMSSVAMQMIQKNLNIAPTLEIRPGYQFNVMITKDIAFSAPYKPYPRP